MCRPIYITFGANSTWELKCDIFCFKVKVNVKAFDIKLDTIIEFYQAFNICVVQLL